MRLAELEGLIVKTTAGERLGRVHEVHVENQEVVALDCGPASMVERLTGRRAGRTAPWRAVRQISEREVIVDFER